MQLEGRRAVVTGAGRGIGAGVAAALARAGARVTALGRNERRLADLVARGDAADYRIADVTDERAVRQAFATSSAVDILVANAGAAESAPFVKSGADVFRRMLDVNLMGAVHAAQATLPDMLAQKRGRIVFIASTAGLRGYPYVSAYVAAKHAVVGLMRVLALETAKSGVTVNAVCPGFTDTDLVEESVERVMERTGRTRDQAAAELTKHNPQGRLVRVEEVADAVLWLCGPGASAITGQAIAVAGGETMA